MKFYVEFKIVFKEAKTETDYRMCTFNLMSLFRETANRVQCSQKGGDLRHLDVLVKKFSPDRASIQLWSQMASQQIINLLGESQAKIEAIGIGQDA